MRGLQDAALRASGAGMESGRASLMNREMSVQTRINMAVLTAFFLAGWLGVGIADTGGVPERRAQMNAAAAQGAAGVPALERGLQDASPLVRRAAARSLAEIGGPAVAVLQAALTNADPVVRRTALMALAGSPPALAALPYIESSLGDADEDVRVMAARLLLAIKPRNQSVTAMMERVARDESPEVRKITADLLAAFQAPERNIMPVRNRPDMADHLERIFVIASRPLPEDGWRLNQDLAPDGHVQRWFDPALDDAGWNPARIGAAWEMDHVGVAWYRGRFDAPARPEKFLAAELVFEGVDECAWVWLNGGYVGGQDLGPSGWNKPFHLDVTEELRWGGENVVAVRVLNSMGAGGIWKPARLDVLGLK